MTALEAPPAPLTAEDLLRMPDGDHYELVDGELRETSMSAESSWIAGNLLAQLGDAAKRGPGGMASPPDLQLRIWRESPNHVRKPDVTFLSRARWPHDSPPATGYLEIAPDLVAEVVSPNDEAEELERKIREYLAAGVAIVWVIYPATRSFHVYRADGSAEIHGEDGLLDAGAVLPGFQPALSSILPPPAAPAAAP